MGLQLYSAANTAQKICVHYGVATQQRRQRCAEKKLFIMLSSLGRGTTVDYHRCPPRKSNLKDHADTSSRRTFLEPPSSLFGNSRVRCRWRPRDASRAAVVFLIFQVLRLSADAVIWQGHYYNFGANFGVSSPSPVPPLPSHQPPAPRGVAWRGVVYS